MFTHLFNRWKIFHIKFSTLNNISRVGWLKNFITLISYKWKVWKQKNMQTWGYQFFSGVTLFMSLRIVTFHAVIRFFVNFGRFLVYILVFWNLFGKLKTNYPQSIVYRFKEIVIAITPKPINRKRLCFAKKYLSAYATSQIVYAAKWKMTALRVIETCQRFTVFSFSLNKNPIGAL